MLPISFHFISLILKTSVFTLTISCLTTNLTWFIDLTSHVPMQYCSFQHWTLLSPQYISPIWHVFWFSLFTGFRAMTLLFPSSLLVTYYPVKWERVIFQCHIFLTFCTLHGFSRQEYVSGLPFPSMWTTFCQNSPASPVHLGWPCEAWLIVHWVTQDCDPGDHFA